jgi:uncharacterized protein (TIGR02145 family)
MFENININKKEFIQMTKKFTDPRDGRDYRIVKIGEQIWMAENLAYECDGSKCYDNEPANVQKYGRLYNWETALKACPEGWHLPTDEEWDALLRFVDGDTGTESPYESETAGKLLKAKDGWNKNDYEDISGNGTDKFGFSALPGGHCHYNGIREEVGDSGGWWSASEFNSADAYHRGIYYNDGSTCYSYDDKSHLFSVRCVKD